MRRYILTLICACMTLSILAATPRLTRSQLKQVQMTKDHKVQPSTAAGGRNSLSLQQVLKQRNLTLDDNKLNTAAPSRFFSLFAGVKMASAEVYDFDWNDATATATVIDSTVALIGKKCDIELGSDNDGLYLTGLYGLYHIPININDFYGVVTIQAGVALTSTSSSVLVNGSIAKVTWTLYAMPLSWLEGGSDYQDIQGVIHADGSIEFIDDFGFLVEKSYKYLERGTVDTSWGLSPIFKNLILYQPNAIHHYETSILEIPAGGEGFVIVNQGNVIPMGSGGSVPKPIKPRPGSFGTTGTVKPVTPRDFTPSGGTKLANQEINGPQVVRNESADLRAEIDTPLTLTFAHPIYMYQIDDTTYMAYNMYGKDYCWNYMNIYPDGNVIIPAQLIGLSKFDDELYNCSMYHAESDTLVWGNHGIYSQNIIDLGDSYLCNITDEDVYKIDQKIINNEIWFIGANYYSWEQLTTPENLTVTPSATTAGVAWQDTLNTSWKLRYRPWMDTSANSIDCNFDVINDDILDDINQNWFILDEDGDGNSWCLTQTLDGDYCLASYSCDLETGYNLNPDNWLITPMVELKGVLRFKVWGDDNYSDKLMPYVCIGEPETLDDFIPLAMNDIHMSSEKTEYVFDLMAFNGQQGYIAFRHHNSKKQFFVCIDDVFVGEGQPVKWTYHSDLSATNCTIDGLTPESLYEVQVRAVGEDAISDWTQLVTFTTLSDIQTGDVNGDGFVKINDVSALINYLLSDDTTGINLDAADCNHDGEIRINDVSALINYLLSGSW